MYTSRNQKLMFFVYLKPDFLLNITFLYEPGAKYFQTRNMIQMETFSNHQYFCQCLRT